MPTDSSQDNASDLSIAFPLRLSHGQLEKINEREAHLILLGIMARTPRGSWAGHTSFGFNEFFSEFSKGGLTREQRTRIVDSTVKGINSVLADLGLSRYRVDSLAFETGDNDRTQDLDGIRSQGSLRDERVVTLMLREIGSDHAIRYVV